MLRRWHRTDAKLWKCHYAGNVIYTTQAISGSQRPPLVGTTCERIEIPAHDIDGSDTGCSLDEIGLADSSVPWAVSRRGPLRARGILSRAGLNGFKSP